MSYSALRGRRGSWSQDGFCKHNTSHACPNMAARKRTKSVPTNLVVVGEILLVCILFIAVVERISHGDERDRSKSSASTQTLYPDSPKNGRDPKNGRESNMASSTPTVTSTYSVIALSARDPSSQKLSTKEQSLEGEARTEQLDLSSFWQLSRRDIVDLGRQTQHHFHIVVFASHTIETLHRLLESLNEAEMDGDTVHMTISIDFEDGNSERGAESLKFVKIFSWIHGRKKVCVRHHARSSLQKWIDCWTAGTADPSERILLLDGGVKVSPMYYLQLKAAMAKYDHMEDLAGYALEHVDPVPSAGKSPEAKSAKEMAEDPTLPGKLAIALNPRTWRDFQQWCRGQAESRRASGSTTAAREDDVPNDFQSWSQRFTSFSQRRRFLPLKPHIRTRTDPVVPKVTLVDQKHTETQAVPKKIAGVDPHAEPSTSSYSKFLQLHKENLDGILHYAALHSGRVSMVAVRRKSVPFMRSFHCNLNLLNIRPTGLAWITSDREILNELVEGKDQAFFFGVRATGAHATAEKKWERALELVTQRTQLTRELLRHNVTVLLLDAEQVWFQDPMPHVHEELKDSTAAIVGLPIRHGKSRGNFLYLRPTTKVKMLYDALVDMIEQASKRTSQPLSAADFADMLSDQALLLKLCSQSKSSQAIFREVFRSLDEDLFPDGWWYRGAYKSKKKSRNPVLVSNNLMEARRVKETRVIKFGHWFYSDTKGACEVPDFTKYYDEAGFLRRERLHLPR